MMHKLIPWLALVLVVPLAGCLMLDDDATPRTPVAPAAKVDGRIWMDKVSYLPAKQGKLSPNLIAVKPTGFYNLKQSVAKRIRDMALQGLELREVRDQEGGADLNIDIIRFEADHLSLGIDWYLEMQYHFSLIEGQTAYSPIIKSHIQTSKFASPNQTLHDLMQDQLDKLLSDMQASSIIGKSRPAVMSRPLAAH